MKRIVRRGKGVASHKELQSIRFKCGACKCVFWADSGEYEYGPYQSCNKFYSSDCPVCKTSARNTDFAPLEYGLFSRRYVTVSRDV